MAVDPALSVPVLAGTVALAVLVRGSGVVVLWDLPAKLLVGVGRGYWPHGSAEGRSPGGTAWPVVASFAHVGGRLVLFAGR